MDREIGAEAGVHRVAEGQHAALSQQHVVRQAEDHHGAHLAQDGQRRALVEDQRRDDQQDDEHGPDQPAAQVDRREAHRGRGCGSSGALHGIHPSLVPIRPLGRNISISTSSRYGRMGAVCAIVRFSTEKPGVSGPTLSAEAGEHAQQRIVERYREGLQQPDQQRGHQRAGQRAHAADHHDHEDDAAHRRRHARLGDEGIAADDAGKPGQRAAAAEHQHEDARHVVAQRLDRVRMGQRGLDHQPDPGAREDQVDRHQHQQRDEHHEAAIHREGGGVEREQRPVHLGRYRVAHRGAAPDQLDHLDDHIGQAEREQQLGHVAELVHGAQPVALDQRADDADQQRRDHQRRPEADLGADRVGEVGAQHVEAGMRKIEHAHHAEDQRQAG